MPDTSPDLSRIASGAEGVTASRSLVLGAQVRAAAGAVPEIPRRSWVDVHRALASPSALSTLRCVCDCRASPVTRDHPFDFRVGSKRV